MKKLWMLKYRPNNIMDYIFPNEERKELIESYIAEKDFPHLFLHGRRGSGKTSLALLLKEQCEIEDVDWLPTNASDDNSVSIIRGKVKNFISTYPSGDMKVVFMDECDALTPEAQDALKAMMEDKADYVRFIFACNKPHKIASEIIDRCTSLKFDSLNDNELMLQSAKILKKEGIKADITILEKLVKESNGSFRSLLNKLQKHSKNGVLIAEINEDDKNFEAKANALLMVGEGDWNSARLALSDKLTDEDYGEMYRFFYENIDQLDKFSDKIKWKQAIVVISDYLYRHEIVADKEINFSACLIKLAEI